MIEVKIGGVTKWKVNEYTFTDPQMGIRSISMSVAHPSSWVDGVAPEVADFTGAYVEYEGEQFYLSSSKPSAEKNTSTIDYTYTLVFKGSEDELTRRKVRDLAEAGVDNYVSQGTVFSIYANINQFVQLLQNNLNYYYENAWTINLAGTSQDSVRIDINNVFLWDLLQKTYEYFGLRFNVRGHTITIGYEPEEIYHVFDYGGDGGLVNITRTAPDTSIVNRLSGTGGSRNVPVNYFSDTYSKFDPDPNPIAGLQRRITNIMPKVFRDSVRNGVLPYIDYVEDTQSILTHGIREDALMPNEDIYPSIAGVSVAGLGRIDEIVAVEVPEVSDPEAEGYVGTFDIWVKDIGFNLADDKYTTTEEATISFTTGYVTGYDFIILAINGVRQVVEDTTKSYGGVQSKYKITLIRSDAELAISDMMLPNQTTSPNAGDNFVIYNINMPQSYVENAEQRVQDWLESNLAELKVEKPSYTIQPMDSFFVTAPLEFDGKSIASKLKSGNRLTVNNTKITNGAQLLYINNVTIQYGGALPKYSFTVTDKVTVEGGAISRLQSQLDGVIGRQLLTEKDIDALLSGFSTKFLSKIKPDTAQQLIQFLNGISVNGLSHLIEGLEVGEYTQGFLGGGAALKMNDGISELEVDKLTVRMVATFFELVISKLTHIGGQLILTPARMKCVRVVEEDTFYKCYFDTGDGEVSNEFVAGDFARCQVFTGSGTKFYWRLVTSVGEDWINLSKTSAAVGSDAPEAGDDIVQLGNATDITRQSAIILSTVGIDAPSWKQYSGINSFSLEGKETTVFSKLGNRIEGKTVFTSGGTNLDDHLDGVAQDILDALRAAQDAEDKAQQAIDDAEANVGLINTEIGKLQAQIDGEVSNWFYPYTPTLANYPASDWTTDEIKDRHIGDTFTNTQTFVDNTSTPDAGKSWRFVKNGSTYSWTAIADSDAVKALLEASKAQATADGKSTTHLFQPTKYKLGDMWVLNADRTINGTAYKQGEILTATQDSETFNEAHWQKRVRYTDDTAVNELEIGGRNYIKSFTNPDWTLVRATVLSPRELVHIGATGQGSANRSNVGVNIEKGQYTFSGLTKGDLQIAIVLRPVGGRGTQKTYYIGPSEEYKLFEYRFNVVLEEENYTLEVGGNSGIAQGLFFKELKLEKGNKATDWTPAPEDVEASIETAKTEAENAAKAYADTKAEAERVLAEAYADGKVSAEEQARIDDVNAKLAAAKAYADAQDALLKAQQEAYADGKMSAAEQAAIDAAKAYADLKKTEAQAYADGIVDAEEAARIADAEAKLQAAKDHAEQLVNDIEIGGRNLLLDSEKERRANNTILKIPFDYSRMVGEGLFTISFEAKINSGDSGEFDFYFRSATASIGGMISPTKEANQDWERFSHTWELTRTQIETILTVAVRTTLYQSDILIRNIKVEKGNKATDWSPAPEDVDKKISDVDAKAADAQAKANTSKAITDKFKTTIDGGLINTVITEFREADSEQVTGLISGIQGANKDLPFLVAGGTYAEGIAGTAKAIIRHDGSVKFTDAEITGKINAITIASGGYIELPPSFQATEKGRMDATGIKLIYDGNNSQNIEWYSGIGTFAGDIKPDSNGYLNINSDFGIKLVTFGTISIGGGFTETINIGGGFTETINIGGGSDETITIGGESSDINIISGSGVIAIGIGSENINIGSGATTVSFGNGIISNIKKITSLGILQFSYTARSISASTNLSISTNEPLIVITSAGSNAGILKILDDSDATPTYGAMKIIVNASTQEIRLKCSTTGSNIRNQASNDDFLIYGNTLAVLVYYGGYWRPHIDRF